MHRQVTVEKQIFRNLDFIFLSINAALVIIGYGLSVYTNGATIESMKILKSFLLLISAVGLIRSMSLNKKSIPSPSVVYILVFCFWVFLISFFAENILFSLKTASGFLAPFVYIYVALHNLLVKYDIYSLLRAFIKSMNIVYAIPVLTYVLSGAGFEQINIYGQSSVAGEIFISNQYGWASTIFILSSIDILFTSRPGKVHRIFLFVFTIAALYITLVSGNRASWLSLILSMLIFVVRLKTVRLDFKFLLMIVPIAGVIWFSKIPNSSLNARLEMTQTQFERGEERLNTANTVIKYFNQKDILWLTGVGMFNYKIIANMPLSDYHNSYLEILFGGGLILFLMFISFMVLRPIYHYVKYYSKYYLLFSPLLIIPFFESNITGGQFLFYPWFIFMLLYNINPEKTLVQKKSVIQKNIPRPKPIHA